MKKAAIAKHPDGGVIDWPAHEGKSREAVLADIGTDPSLPSAFVVRDFSAGIANLSLTEVCRSLRDRAEIVRSGKLSDLEEMLGGQAVALNSMFSELARRAAMNLGTHIEVAEIYLKLAFRAQSQCRATIEALAEIKNPPLVFAKQANIAQGPQQVNNYQDSACAEKTENPQNELMEHDHGERLDTRTKAAAFRSNQKVATVETVNRATNKERKGCGKSK